MNILKKKHLLTNQSFSVKSDTNKKLYPSCDVSIWLRSCENEIAEPISGRVQGHIPEWLSGSLLRNGPGGLHVGEMRFDHLFDSAALIHKLI